MSSCHYKDLYLRSIIIGILILFLIPSEIAYAQQTYSLRKYAHVKGFYEKIAKEATQICIDNNVPPAAILSIAALESGWNKGYIGRISGNILSLNSINKNRQLPKLYLPTLKSENKVLFDSLEIKRYAKDDLIWKDRPASYKKDYRPYPWKGTPYNLAYFKYNPTEKKKAHLKNISDFVSSFIGRNSKIKAYREARKQMDSLVAIHGKKILLDKTTAYQFIDAIGGKPNSFNYRDTWPIKIKNLIQKAGLVSLTTQLHKGNSFESAWTKN